LFADDFVVVALSNRQAEWSGNVGFPAALLLVVVRNLLDPQ
jgi:hypothetical protein